MVLLAFVCSLAACGSTSPTGRPAAAVAIVPAATTASIATVAPTTAPTIRPTMPAATEAPAAPTSAPTVTVSRPTANPAGRPTNAPTPASTATAARSPSGTPIGDIDFVVITLERGPCFGGCPVYKVTLRGTGEVTWEGTRFVKVMGPASAKVNPDAVRGLLDELVRAGYFDMSDKYTKANATDMPSAVTSVTLSGRAKTINHYYGDFSAPKALTDLEKRIDEVAGTAQWIK